ncbi:MAG: type II toxin-antitoxin system PemK/MazF family toxin [Microcystaceae cyanobacterium]
MKRGEVYDARLEPVEGSEQGGTRPVIIVSRNVINAYSPVVLAVPCTTYQRSKQVYPTQALIQAPDGGLTKDSIAQWPIRCEYYPKHAFFDYEERSVAKQYYS